MRKLRIERRCLICKKRFEIRPCEIKAIVTCSKDCSTLYKKKPTKNRKKVWKLRKGKKMPNRKSPPPMSEETKAKISNANKGKAGHWNGRKLSEETKAKMSLIRTGKSNKGWVISEQGRLNMSLGKKGEKCHLWKGGVTKENTLIRQGLEYRLWREAVFKRDDYTCQKCNKRGVHLHAHHIKQFAEHPELRFDINNGQSLCILCHKETDTFLKGGGVKKRVKKLMKSEKNIDILEVK